MTERNNWPLTIQYLAILHDGTFDVNMTSSEVVRTRHHIRRFQRRSPVLKIKPNTGQTLGTTDKIVDPQGPIISFRHNFTKKYFFSKVRLVSDSARSDLSKEPIKSEYLCKNAKK